MKNQEIAEQIEYVQRCDDENILLDIARDNDKDVSVRIAACDKITSGEKLNYLLAASPLSKNAKELMIALHIAPRVEDHELINATMQDFLFTTFLASSSSELLTKAISFITNTSTLEEFIEFAERTRKFGSSVIESAYARLFELSEKE